MKYKIERYQKRICSWYSFIRRVSLLPNMIKNVKNWPICFAAYFGLTKGEVTYILRDGSQILAEADPQNIGVILDVIALDCYKAFQIEREDIVVDIGAHVGTFSILATKRARNGKIFAFEPLPHNFSFLQKNIRLNSLSNVLCFNKAVGERHGKRRLFIPELKGKQFYSAASFYTNSPLAFRNFIEVETVTLEDILNEVGKIDFLKIDAEGAEVEILLTLKGKLFDKIKRISLECHDYYFNHPIHRDLQNVLSGYGFQVEIRTTLFANIASEMLYAVRN